MKHRATSFSRRDFLWQASLLTAAGAGIQGCTSVHESAPDRALASHGPGLHHILRVFLPADAAERRTTEVIDYCRRTGCHEVLLFTTSYDEAPSFAPLDEIAAYVTAIEPQAKRLREAGITVDVNVLQTLGHVYFPKAMSAQFPFQRRVYFDGSVSTEGACPLCPKLGEWVAGAYKQYARLRPPVMFVDDDYRTYMAGKVSCFCPLHLAEIGKLAGHAVTRDEVVAAITSTEYPAPALRRYYYDATTRGFVELAEQIHRTVHAASPKTRLGVMLANWPLGAQGMDIAQVARTLAGPGGRPLVRPQIPMYSEDYIRDAAHSFLNPARMRAVLPNDVEHWPEIENYQYTAYAKGARCTVAQMAACVLNGFDHLALNVFDMYDSPLSDGRPLIDMLEGRRRFLDRLHELVPCGSRADGASVFEHPDQLLVRRAKSMGEVFASHRITRHLPNLGLPVTFGRTTPWQVLSGDDVLALEDKGLDALLSRGALMDVSAAQALALRGCAGRIGVTVGDAIAVDDLGFELFADAEISPSLHGRKFPLRALVSGGEWHRLTASAAKSRAASEIRNYHREPVAPALLLTENDRGERFAVLAFNHGGNRHLFENLMRPEQFRGALGWIARKPLPVCTHHDAAYLWPILNRTADGRLIIGLVNVSTDTYEQLPLVMDRTIAPKKLSVVMPSGDIATAVFTTSPGDRNSTVRVDVRQRLEPMEVTALVVEA